MYRMPPLWLARVPLVSIYEGMTRPNGELYAYGGDQTAIIAAVQATANANHAAGVSVTIDPADMALGHGIRTEKSILLPRTSRGGAESSPGETHCERRDQHLLANVFGMSSVNVRAGDGRYHALSDRRRQASWMCPSRSRSITSLSSVAETQFNCIPMMARRSPVRLAYL